jgi:hypothetical protein
MMGEEKEEAWRVPGYLLPKAIDCFGHFCNLLLRTECFEFPKGKNYEMILSICADQCLEAQSQFDCSDPRLGPHAITSTDSHQYTIKKMLKYLRNSFHVPSTFFFSHLHLDS